MEVALVVIGVVVMVLLSLILLKQYKKEEVVEDKSFMILQDQLERMTRVMDDRLHRSQSELHQVLHRQDSEAKKLITEITKELTEVKEGNKQVFSMTEQLQNLEKVLTHQKQRGNLGEASLELILSNMLAPGQYEMQYRFKTGEVVDAIIQTKDGFIPIDAKYSLDNYQRLMNAEGEDDTAYFQNEFKKDIQKRIDETAKYIKPDEGTLPFAFMFIPAEGIYYDLLVNQSAKGSVNTQNLIEYAYNKRKVIIVSPTTFYAYLQSVLFGFKAFKIEESAKHIEARVGELGRHIAVYEDYMKKLGTTLGTTVNHYNLAYKELKKIDKDVTKITGVAVGVEPELLEKPVMEAD
jgi:DNA recombination protein RmuC